MYRNAQKWIKIPRMDGMDRNPKVDENPEMDLNKEMD